MLLLQKMLKALLAILWEMIRANLLYQALDDPFLAQIYSALDQQMLDFVLNQVHTGAPSVRHPLVIPDTAIDGAGSALLPAQ